MSKEERYAQILEILRTRNNVTVNYLAKKLYVSPSTIRRDYQVLQTRGLLRHSYGKATLNYGEALGLPIELRQRDMPAAKLKIGRAAAELVQNNDIIYIDSSSTALCMIEHLERFNCLTVITNCLTTLQQLSYYNNITVYTLGGMLMSKSRAFTGQLAIDTLSHLHIDKCFFSTTGLSTDGRLLDVADLSCEGTITLGASLAAMFIWKGVNPFLAAVLAFAGGALAGIITGVLHTKLKIPAILAGILTMISCYSINIHTHTIIPIIYCTILIYNTFL